MRVLKYGVGNHQGYKVLTEILRETEPELLDFAAREGDVGVQFLGGKDERDQKN